MTIFEREQKRGPICFQTKEDHMIDIIVLALSEKAFQTAYHLADRILNASIYDSYSEEALDFADELVTAIEEETGYSYY